jgi:hypothetical protein
MLLSPGYPPGVGINDPGSRQQAEESGKPNRDPQKRPFDLFMDIRKDMRNSLRRSPPGRDGVV